MHFFFFLNVADLSFQGRNFFGLCHLISLLICCLSSCRLPTLWEPLHAKPLAIGGKVVASVQVSPPELDVPERTLCSTGLSLWRLWRKLWSGSGWTSLWSWSCLPTVYVSVLPGLCLLLGWECPAKNSSSPCCYAANTPPAFSMISLSWIERCLITVWRLQKFPWQDEWWTRQPVLAFWSCPPIFPVLIL